MLYNQEQLLLLSSRPAFAMVKAAQQSWTLDAACLGPQTSLQ
jgi:hypothetical protein